MKNTDYSVEKAINEIRETYKENVSVDLKNKSLIKFGRNESVSNTGFVLVSQLGDETLVSTNIIDTVSSSNAGDNQVITVEGHTINGSNELTFVTQNITLNGQTKVVLPTPLARANRLINKGSADFAGDVYVYQEQAITLGVPQTLNQTHLKASTSDNQSLKCATAISNSDYWIVTKLVGGVNRNTQVRNVDFKFQIKPIGGVWTTKYPFTASTSSGTITIHLDQPLIIPKNHDVRIIAESSGTSTIVNAAMHGFLATIRAK